MDKKKIIICDDQAIFRELTASYLQINGWDVLRAQTGEECIELAKNNDVAVILLDVKMPGIGGYETVKALKNLDISAEIILMTGFIPKDQECEAKAADVSTVFLKPFDLKMLQKQISYHLAETEQENPSNKILLVEDEDLLREMLEMYLKKNGFEVVSCKNGQECLDMVDKERFKAILMDIRMPVLDGLGALKALRERNNNTPVVLMSGFCELKSGDDAKQRGATAFLAKPFKPAVAIDILKSELSKQAG